MKEEQAYISMEVATLIVGYRRGILTDEENRRLNDWKDASEANRKLFEELMEDPGEIDAYRGAFQRIDTVQALHQLKARIAIEAVNGRNAGDEVTPIRRMRRKSTWLRAAVVFAVLTIGLALYIHYEGRFLGSDTQTETPLQADIGPGGNRATLRLADGSSIDLSKDKEGIVLGADGIAYSDGTLLPAVGPQSAGTQPTPMGDQLQQLKLTTPRGGQYQLLLSDGTKVWLNASSSIGYPATFVKDGRRIVELDGEAYFEVKHDPERPFIVRSGQQEVEVLGTRFNLSDYGDDGYSRTTLLDGAVRVSDISGKNTVRLTPGQQSTWHTSEGELKVHDADIEEAIAWKEGYFKFNDESLLSIMRKISRWYDVDVRYQGAVSPDQVFSGRISKADSVSSVLEMLELTGGVRFQIEERRIVVME